MIKLRLSGREHVAPTRRWRLDTKTEEVEAATCGALELVDGGAPITARVIGPGKGDTHFSADVRSHGNVVARVLLGPRVNAYPYDPDCNDRLGRVVAVVGMALDRIPARS